MKGIRITGIILLAVTAVFTLLGGIGTSCVAFGAENWGPGMAPLIPVKPYFQILVVVSIAASIFGGWTCFGLGKGRKGSYRNSLIFLVVGLVAAGIQMYFSATLRGKTAPNNIRVYLTALTLLYFFVMRLPGIRSKTGFENAFNHNPLPPAAGGAALLLSGVITLSCPIWAGQTHFINGYNTVTELNWPLFAGGIILMFLGMMVTFFSRNKDFRISAPVTSK